MTTSLIKLTSQQCPHVWQFEPPLCPQVSGILVPDNSWVWVKLGHAAQ
jgi:hypothetical protein